MRASAARLEEIVEGAPTTVFAPMIDRGQPAVAVDANAKCLAGRRTDGLPAVHACFTTQTSLTGRPTSPGRHEPRTCGRTSGPLEPKPPPEGGLRMWIILSGRMPNSPRSVPGPWRGPCSGIDLQRSRRPHAATMA